MHVYLDNTLNSNPPDKVP